MREEGQVFPVTILAMKGDDELAYFRRNAIGVEKFSTRGATLLTRFRVSLSEDVTRRIFGPSQEEFIMCEACPVSRFFLSAAAIYSNLR